MIIDLGKNIKVIRPEAQAMFPYSNSMLVNGEARLLIDAGAGGKAYEGIEPQSVDMLLLTHHHFDHVNGLPFFTRAQIRAGQEEEAGYRDPDVYFSWAGFKHWERLMGELKAERFAGNMTLPDDVPLQPGFNFVQLDGLIKDGDVFDLGRLKIHAIHSPGHTHGHYAFYIEKEGILFAGDIDMAPRGAWYGGEDSSFIELVESAEKLRALKPRILVTSHRKVFDRREYDIDQLFKDYIGIGLRKEALLLEYLRQPRSLMDIVKQEFFYDFKPEERTVYNIFWSRMMAVKHLERLEKLGQIRYIDKDYYERT